MKKKIFLAVILVILLSLSLCACGSGSSKKSDRSDKKTSSKDKDSESKKKKKKKEKKGTDVAPATEAPATEIPAAEESMHTGIKIGISLPTVEYQRWKQDGSIMKGELEALGYDVELQYASNDVQAQISQLENMISNLGCNVLVVAAIDGSSLSSVLDMATENGIPVISYDRLIMNSGAVSYYVTFNNFMVGAKQAEYIEKALDLENAAGPFNMEITSGDPHDNNGYLFYQGAMYYLKKYIDQGKLNIVSNQIEYEDVATSNWDTTTAGERAKSIIADNYSDGTRIDVWLCSNDSTALGVVKALEDNYDVDTYGWPIITGQDCDKANVKNIIAGKQSMSVFKDTRVLASQTVKMVNQIVTGLDIEINDSSTYDNGVAIIPSYLCEPVFVDSYNYRELLIDSGYYTDADLSY